MEQGPLNSLFKHTKQNITDTVEAIPVSTLAGRRSMVIRNEGSNTIYIGSSSVSVANGYPLKSGEEKPFDVGKDIILYGIVATGTEELRILEGA